MQKGLNLLRVPSSHQEFPSIQEVQQVIWVMQQEGSTLSDETKKLVMILNDGITLGEGKLKIENTEAATFWTKDMLKAIDEVATNGFKNCTNQIRMPEDVYLNALTTYVANISTMFQQYLAHAELVIMWLIWAMHPRKGGSTPLPLLTEDVIWSITELLKIVELGIVEVSLFRSMQDVSPHELMTISLQDRVLIRKKLTIIL
jgi:hypothetical protein